MAPAKMGPKVTDVSLSDNNVTDGLVAFVTLFDNVITCVQEHH